MTTFKKISNIFSDAFKANSNSTNYTAQLDKLIFSCMEINLNLWKLEDIARMKDLGFESIANAKMEIDKNNQIRNENIRSMDLEFEQTLNNKILVPNENFHAESPAMLIDRIAILFIKRQMIEKIETLIADKNLRDEYLKKGKIVEEQLNDSGKFLDSYLQKIQKGVAFFKVYEPIKIYNDERIRNYIKNLAQNEQ